MIHLQEPPDQKARTIVEFCRFAREKGLSAGVQETLGALQAAMILGVNNTEDLKLGLRSTLCASKDEWDLFEECFQMFWSGAEFAPPSSRKARGKNARSAGMGSRDSAPLMPTGSSDHDSSGKDRALAVSGASAQERLTKADVSTLPHNDMAMLEQIALRLFKQMSRRLQRRRRIGTSRGQVDLRRTIRRSISRGGEPINLRYREKKLRPHRLVTLLDISGSMSPYSLFLVKFLYALQKHFQRADTFLFSTNLVEITNLLRAQRLPQALQALSQQPAGWSGGTNIGGSLREFNQHYTRKLRSSDTLFVILSDGWDTGEPSALATELGAVKRSVRKLIWLNPLLGLQDYQPITIGMSAALPHIDVFAPAHNLESLLALEKHL
ncbi:MAG: VWA domain-containing protein [Candidatus Sulfotelmatobacter sp.]|jgi:uncharacterized protein with von Willebrand factor type A (vWA) domain